MIRNKVEVILSFVSVITTDSPIYWILNKVLTEIVNANLLVRNLILVQRQRRAQKVNVIPKLNKDRV